MHFRPGAKLSFVDKLIALTSARNLLGGQVLLLNWTIIKTDVVEEKKTTRRYIQKVHKNP